MKVYHKIQRESTVTPSITSSPEPLQSPRDKLEPSLEFEKSPAEIMKSPLQDVKSPLRTFKSPILDLKSPDEIVKSPIQTDKPPPQKLQSPRFISSRSDSFGDKSGVSVTSDESNSELSVHISSQKSPNEW